jgi:hypothetical protein
VTVYVPPLEFELFAEPLLEVLGVLEELEVLEVLEEHPAAVIEAMMATVQAASHRFLASIVARPPCPHSSRNIA